ncbi:MAG TPA: hypothetical protein VEB20_07765 [Azospirillaceae bacterium]|nr:hypothetical protein [Azospirillaceae bacterium]
MIRSCMAAAAAVALLAVAPAAGATDLSCDVPAWRVMYQHDADGRPVAGEKEALFRAVRRGDALRLAWGGSFTTKDGTVLTVEHAAEPVFTTIANGREVVAQLPEHIAQAAYHDPDKARFEAGQVMWRGLMSTDGTFEAVWVDRAGGQTVRRMPQRARIAWLAFAPDPACDTRSPLELAVPGGVRLDERAPPAK